MLYRVQHKSDDGRWFDYSKPVGLSAAEIMVKMAENQGIKCRLIDAATGAPCGMNV